MTLHGLAGPAVAVFLSLAETALAEVLEPEPLLGAGASHRLTACAQRSFNATGT